MFEVDSVFWTSCALVLIILMNMVINIIRIVFDVFNCFVTFFYRIEMNLTV